MNPLQMQQEWNGGERGYCHKEHKACVGWVETYLNDCLCSLSDEISFGFGLFSLLAWAVAELPQIVTNFRTKSSHGVSILFLLTWVFGDIFNLVGCLLEPATLPTQYYTALLYTISTVVLLLQSLYYDHFYKGSSPTLEEEDEAKRPLNPKIEDNNKDVEDGTRGGNGMLIPTAPRPSSRRDCYYFTSARSMAGSSTPPFRSYLSRRAAKSGPSAVAFPQDDHSSSEDENPTPSRHPAATTPVPIPRSVSLIINLPSFISYNHMLLLPSASLNLFLNCQAAQRLVLATVSLSLPFHSNAIYQRLTRTNLFQDASEHSALGQWLGWIMAAIYMGGRFPQIILNIKRGSVEGLNPLMFIFALVANVSYVASILVRSTEWKKIKANLPWLLDAVVCVALDLFIILQYVYYKYMRKKESSYAEDDDAKDISKEADQSKSN